MDTPVLKLRSVCPKPGSRLPSTAPGGLRSLYISSFPTLIMPADPLALFGSLPYHSGLSQLQTGLSTSEDQLAHTRETSKDGLRLQAWLRAGAQAPWTPLSVGVLGLALLSKGWTRDHNFTMKPLKLKVSGPSFASALPRPGRSLASMLTWSRVFVKSANVRHFYCSWIRMLLFLSRFPLDGLCLQVGRQGDTGEAPSIPGMG